ncbi:hypothetical protein ANN_27863 [Periplaneta americana]|uniref:C2H2-type domain-containing protein n=1 Tax=Periplaneta americana TaxID=6978 RepID=A0ABQ8RVB7_PERAM|nr:hypothetical protein ANN_27863 [Periplaneta americana]
MRKDVVMDLIKMKPEVDPLDIQAHDDTYEIEENKNSSEEGKLSHLEVTGMKAECVDHSYDIKTEIKVEDTPVPTSFGFVKSEDEEEFFDLNRVQQERKVEVCSEDELFRESILGNVAKNVSQERTGIHEEDKLTLGGSDTPDCSNISDESRNSFKCNICNEAFLTQQSLKLHSHIQKMKTTFKCDVCGKCFLELSDTKRHALLHTRGLPFHCSVCDLASLKARADCINPTTCALPAAGALVSRMLARKVSKLRDFVMEEIKMEREIDPLAIERSNNTDIEEQKPLSEEGNLLDLQVTGIKRENMDYSNDIKTEMTFDETPVSSSFLFVKTEVEVSAVYEVSWLLVLCYEVTDMTCIQVTME